MTWLYVVLISFATSIVTVAGAVALIGRTIRKQLGPMLGMMKPQANTTGGGARIVSRTTEIG